MLSTCESHPTTTLTSSPARSCGRCGRRSGGAAPRAPAGASFDPGRGQRRGNGTHERGHREVNETRERVHDVVLAEIDDGQQHADRPDDQSDGKGAIPAPRVYRGQRGERRVKRWKRGELVWIQVRVEG